MAAWSRCTGIYLPGDGSGNSRMVDISSRTDEGDGKLQPAMAVTMRLFSTAALCFRMRLQVELPMG